MVDQEPGITVSRGIGEAISPSQFAQNQLGFLVTIDTDRPAPGGGPVTFGTMFQLYAGNFHIEGGVTPTGPYLIRNDVRVDCLAFGDTWRIWFHWTPTRITVGATDVIGQRMCGKDTPVTCMPQSIRDAVRTHTLTQALSYALPALAVNDIEASLGLLSEKISRTGPDGFWDVAREGNRVVRRTPKRETDIQPTLHWLLDDFAYLKSINIAAEPRLGRGNLDFLLSAPLNGGGLVKICMECKRAHSRDLWNGLRCQLPEYMNRVGTDHGIYLVLDFGADHPPYQPEIDRLFPDLDTEMPIDMLLSLEATQVPGVRTAVLDVSPGTAPSHMRDAWR